MGVDHIAILIDDALLERQIANFRAGMSDEEIERGDARFHDDLEFDRQRGLTPYEFGDLKGYANDRWLYDGEIIRFKLLAAARDANGEVLLNADRFYRFFGLINTMVNIPHPFNEYGFTQSVIMGVKNAQIWHSFFQTIDFECLRSLFEEQTKSLDPLRIGTFEDLVGYAKALDGLLVQAIDKNKTLYLFAA